jgi:hypothetical protein
LLYLIAAGFFLALLGQKGGTTMAWFGRRQEPEEDEYPTGIIELPQRKRSTQKLDPLLPTYPSIPYHAVNEHAQLQLYVGSDDEDSSELNEDADTPRSLWRRLFG